MSVHMTRAVTARVLAQLRRDPRTLALVLVVPCVLETILRELWTTFHELAAAGATLLVSSHVMDEADRCDELVLLRDGKVLATGAPAELRVRTHAETLEDVFLQLVEAT